MILARRGWQNLTIKVGMKLASENVYIFSLRVYSARWRGVPNSDKIRHLRETPATRVEEGQKESTSQGQESWHNMEILIVNSARSLEFT